MLLSQTIHEATKRLTSTSLNKLILEYDFPENSLDGLRHVLAVLKHYNIILDPPESDHDLDFERTLKPRREVDEITSEIQEILAAGGEKHSVELKSSIRINRKKQEHNPGREIGEYVDDRLAMKLAQEICAFLNRDGGLILLGIANDHSILGCDDDFDAFPGDGTPEDKADLLLRQIVEQYFRKPMVVLSKLQVDCAIFEGKRVVVLRVASAGSLCLLKDNCGSPCQLYLRLGTSAQPIKFEELEEYYLVKLNLA